MVTFKVLRDYSKIQSMGSVIRIRPFLEILLYTEYIKDVQHIPKKCEVPENFQTHPWRVIGTYEGVTGLKSQ